MSNFEFKVVSAKDLDQDYFLRSFIGDQTGEMLDLQFEYKGKKLISATFFCTQDMAFSLPMAPFGGIWKNTELDQAEWLSLFLDASLSYFQGKRIRLVQLVQPPRVYESLTELINNSLFKKGFGIKVIQSHQFLNGKKYIREFFENQQAKWEKKLLSGQLNLHISPIVNFGFLRDIQNWNTAKGYHLNWEEDRLIQQVSLFPDKYFKITVSQQDMPQAHAVAVMLTSEVLYYFLSANNPNSAVKNLGEFLLFGLIKLGKKEKVNAIDLGSSEVDGNFNFNLMYFKSRFSNEISNKITWEIIL